MPPPPILYFSVPLPEERLSSKPNLHNLLKYDYAERGGKKLSRSAASLGPSHRSPADANKDKTLSFCIVDRDAKELAAVISSYLFEADTCAPLFLFGRAQVPRGEDAAFMSEGYVSYLMVEHASVLIQNALARMGGCEYVVLAGLTEAQKTYLCFGTSQKIIEITKTSEIDSKLVRLLIPNHRERCVHPKVTDKSGFIGRRPSSRWEPQGATFSSD